MKLAELKAACLFGESITIASARTGRILVQNAMKSNGAMLGLDVFGIQSKMRISRDGTFAMAYFYCYAYDDECKRLKETANA